MRSRRAVIAALAVLSLTVLGGCASGGDVPPATPTFEGACGYIGTGSAAHEVELPPASPEVSGELDAIIDTSAGAIPITLNADAAPCTVGSFVSLAEQRYFDDTPCHRLTTAGIFVLQCGDPSGTGSGGPGYRYADELDGAETYPAGTVAMANAGPDTNGSQFFLVYDDTALRPEYTVFGTISPEGVEVVREIAAAGAAGAAGGDGPPTEPVGITTVTVD